jgi:hypothetical protein
MYSWRLICWFWSWSICANAWAAEVGGQRHGDHPGDHDLARLDRDDVGGLVLRQLAVAIAVERREHLLAMGLGLLLADLPVAVAVDPLLAGHLLALRAVLLLALLAFVGLLLTALLTLRSLLLVAALRLGVAAGGMSGAAVPASAPARSCVQRLHG